MVGEVRANGQEGVAGKTLSICISRVANEQNQGDPYPTYQSAIKPLHERIASLAAGSISTSATSLTRFLFGLPLGGCTEEKSLVHLSFDHLTKARGACLQESVILASSLV